MKVPPIAGNERLEWFVFIFCDILIGVLGYYDKQLYDLGPAGQVDLVMFGLLPMVIGAEGFYLHFRYVSRECSNRFICSAFHGAITDTEPVQTIDPVYRNKKLVYPTMNVIEFGVSAPVMLAVRSKVAIVPSFMSKELYGILLGYGLFKTYEGKRHNDLPPQVTAAMDGRFMTMGETEILYAPSVDDWVAVEKDSKWAINDKAATDQSEMLEIEVCHAIYRSHEEYERIQANIRAMGGNFEYFVAMARGEKVDG
jgi:hypothetical protein